MVAAAAAATEWQSQMAEAVAVRRGCQRAALEYLWSKLQQCMESSREYLHVPKAKAAAAKAKGVALLHLV